MKNIQFFSDFDGTITKEDTLNKFLNIYAGETWKEAEEKWIRGEIGSKECLKEQMKLLPYIEDSQLEGFVSSIEIDETFIDFYDYLKSENIDFFVVSDGFDLFINKILARYGITDVNIYSNKLELKEGKFIVDFPFSNENCRRKSGTCKCKIVEQNRIVTKRVIYAGDGISDFCVSDKVDVLFAKGTLLEYCKNTRNTNLIGFSSFKDIKDYIKNQ